jgi:hypothetical protein
MNSNDSDIYEVIERYFSGALSKEERDSFEAQFISDEALKQKVDIFKASRNAILQNKLKDLKELMAAESSKVNKPGSLNKLWSAIIIVSLLGSGFFIWHTNKKPNQYNVQQDRVSGKPSDSSSESNDQTDDKVQTKDNVGIEHAEKKSGESKVAIAESEKNSVEETREESKVIPPSENLDKRHQTNPVAPKDSAVHASDIPADLCKGVKIAAQSVLNEPCAGSNDGFIELKDLHGGKAPYVVTVNGVEHGNSTHLKELAGGRYEIKVRDRNGCIHHFNPLILKEKDCVLRYDFNPGRGEEWQGPVVDASRLTIMDKSGKVVYTKQMDNGEQCTWNGYNQSGTLLHGYFVFIIEQKNGKVIKGSITVTE